jgi:hypothetical protein
MAGDAMKPEPISILIPDDHVDEKWQHIGSPQARSLLKDMEGKAKAPAGAGSAAPEGSLAPSEVLGDLGDIAPSERTLIEANGRPVEFARLQDAVIRCSK